MNLLVVEFHYGQFAEVPVLHLASMLAAKSANYWWRVDQGDEETHKKYAESLRYFIDMAKPTFNRMGFMREVRNELSWELILPFAVRSCMDSRLTPEDIKREWETESAQMRLVERHRPYATCEGDYIEVKPKRGGAYELARVTKMQEHLITQVRVLGSGGIGQGEHSMNYLWYRTIVDKEMVSAVTQYRLAEEAEEERRREDEATAAVSGRKRRI